MNAAIYARKSTEQKVADEAKSVTRQVELAREFAASKGWAVREQHVYVDDGISGALFEDQRPGLAALLVAADRREFGAVVTMDESRIGRDQYRAAYVLQQLHDKGVAVWFYQDSRRVQMDDATGKFMESVRGYAAEIEREKASARSLETLRKKAREGHVPGGRIFGFRNVRVGEGGPVRRVIDEGQAEVVRRIFAMHAEGQNVTAIRNALNARAVPGPRAPKPWSISSIRDVLANEAYAGRMVWGRTRRAIRKGRVVNVPVPESEWIRVEVPGPRLVDEQTWARVQERRAAFRDRLPRLPAGSGTDADGRPRGGRLMGRASQADHQSECALSGFVACAICGQNLWLKTVRRGPKGRTRLLRRYGCSSHRSRGEQACLNGTMVAQPVLERAVREAVLRALGPEAVAPALESALAAHREQLIGRDARRTALERDLAQIRQREERLVAAVARGGEIEPLVDALKGERAKREAAEAEMLELTGPAARQKLWVLHEDHYRKAVRQRLDDVIVLLGSATGIGPVRQMLRRALSGPVRCWPTEQEGRKGFRFEVALALGKLLSGEATATSRTVATPTCTDTPCRCRGAPSARSAAGPRGPARPVEAPRTPARGAPAPRR